MTKIIDEEVQGWRRSGVDIEVLILMALVAGVVIAIISSDVPNF